MIRKNPSFARLRRVWETTRSFWQGALSGLTTIGPRLEIRGDLHPDRPNDTLGPFHTYELVLGRVRLSVVWDSDQDRFITCDNLTYLAKPELLGRKVREALVISEEISIEEPAGYGARNKAWGKVVARQVNEMPDHYRPAISILAEPRTFMALVPADKALDMVEAIKAKYEHEMGKVRNRLPLTLGVIYAGRRTPLAALLDAGRRMLRRSAPTGKAELACITKIDPLAGGWPASVKIALKIGEREVAVTVPTVMGDGATHDVWYPYWQVANRPTDRTHWFAGPDGEHWVHVTDLCLGDQVAFTPSTFDFEYLDTTARRFEVSYASDGQRRGQVKRQRPYLLEELDRIKEVWATLSRLPVSQIKALEALIEGKRAAWCEPTGAQTVSPTFRHFVREVMQQTGMCGADLERLERAAVCGLLADALELHLSIAKEDPEMCKVSQTAQVDLA
jgi:hypothetical protein